MAGLPTDNVSTENGVIMANARRWPFALTHRLRQTDSSSVSVRSTQRMAGCCETKQQESDANHGKWCAIWKVVLMENVGESLDAALETDSTQRL